MPRKSKFSEIQKQEMVQRYKDGNCTLTSLAKEYGSFRKIITSILLKNNVIIKSQNESQRLFPLNQEFFDIIDTEEKAYFLGLLYADGYNNEERNLIQLSLSEEDVDILHSFNKSLESSKKLEFLNIKKRNPKWKNAYRLSINSIKISKRLAELGCWQRKSLTLKFPTEDQVPSHLLRHFIRGYFDGDGCICLSTNRAGINKNKQVYTFSVISTKDFCSGLKNTISKNIDIDCRMYDLGKNYNISTKVIAKSGQLALEILKWLYQDATVYLQRKYNKYLECLSNKKDKMKLNEAKQQISELFDENKKLIKFPTYNLRKAFIKKLITIIEDGVETEKEAGVVDRTDVQRATTPLRTTTNAPAGSVVLTEQMSQLSDEMPKTSNRMIRHQQIKN